MKNCSLILVVSLIFLEPTTNCFVKTVSGVTVDISDYTKRGQREVFPQLGITAQDLVKITICPLKIIVTNASTEIVEVSPGSMDLVQLDCLNVHKKLKYRIMSNGQNSALCGTIFAALLGTSYLFDEIILAPFNISPTTVAVFSACIAPALIAYVAWDTSWRIKELALLLSTHTLHNAVKVEPGKTVEKFVFIQEYEYNKITACNIILKKGTQEIAFHMPLD